MSVEGLHDALGERADVVTLRPARLPGWRRIWNVFRPEWNGGVLNLEPSPSDVVVGMLVEGLTEDDIQLLDSKESTHLPRDTVYVEPFSRRGGAGAGLPPPQGQPRGQALGPLQDGRARARLPRRLGSLREPVPRARSTRPAIR